MSDTTTPPAPSTPPAPPAPSGPSETDIRGWIRDELADILGGGSGGGKGGDRPPRNDRELEAYVNRLVREGIDKLRADEAAAGKTPPDPNPDPTREPETQPESVVPWQEKLRKFFWQ